jgi:hypothetical protein
MILERETRSSKRLPGPAATRFDTDRSSLALGIDFIGIVRPRLERTGRFSSDLEQRPRRHHSSFSPNWTCRELVEVELITPAVGDGAPVAAVNTTGFGVLKFVRLSRLKNSARN